VKCAHPSAESHGKCRRFKTPFEVEQISKKNQVTFFPILGLTAQERYRDYQQAPLPSFSEKRLCELEKNVSFTPIWKTAQGKVDFAGVRPFLVESVARREPASSITMDIFVRRQSFSHRFSSTKEMPAPGISTVRLFR
jgi:hypothetical protein